MTTRDELAAELESIRKTNRTISVAVWSVAGLVMFFGIPIVVKFLTENGIPGEIAWMLSIASDGALIVGLVATPVLAAYSVPAGWVGTLRWIAGFMTWALQTAEPWTKDSGVDWEGVGAHSAGPILLFVVVEAASYFQRKMGVVVSTKKLALERMERVKADERATLEDLRRRLSAAESERAEALSAAERWESEALSTAADRDSLVTSLEERARSAEETARALQSEHAETLRRLRREHKEALSAAVAEVSGDPSVIRLSDRRRPSGDPSATAAGDPSGPLLEGKFSDAAAVQALLEYDGDLSKKWSQSEIVKLLRVGFTRAPRLVEMVSDEQLRRLSEETSGDLSTEAEATG